MAWQLAMQCLTFLSLTTCGLFVCLSVCLSWRSLTCRGLLLEGVVGSQANSKVTLRQLEKLSKRLIKRYNLPLEDFPYTAALNARKSLHFILVQRYRLKTVSDANLDELLKVGPSGAGSRPWVL